MALGFPEVITEQGPVAAYAVDPVALPLALELHKQVARPLSSPVLGLHEVGHARPPFQLEQDGSGFRVDHPRRPVVPSSDDAPTVRTERRAAVGAHHPFRIEQ